jgi:hypothetical protein
VSKWSWTDGVGRAQQGLDGEEDGSDLEGGRPFLCVRDLLSLLDEDSRLAFQNVEADAACIALIIRTRRRPLQTYLVDVGVVDLGQTSDLGRFHRIRVREEELLDIHLDLEVVRGPYLQLEQAA